MRSCLTLNKIDFIRAGSRGATYLAYRKTIQEAVARQLTEWGDAAEGGEREHRRAARPVERDLEAVLMDLADDFPLLASLVEQRAGGQRRLPMAGPGKDTSALTSGAALVAAALLGAGDSMPPEHSTSPERGPARDGGAGDVAGDGAPSAGDDASPSERPLLPGADAASVRAPNPGAGMQRRPGRYGLAIQFEQRPDDPELARLVESTVWINEAHPAYRRAAASRAEGYHIALASALALASLAVEPAKERAFVTAFLASWGAALDRRRPARRR